MNLRDKGWKGDGRGDSGRPKQGGRGGREGGREGERAYREGHEGHERVTVDGDSLNEGQGQLDVSKGSPEEEGDEGLREGGREGGKERRVRNYKGTLPTVIIYLKWQSSPSFLPSLPPSLPPSPRTAKP